MQSPFAIFRKHQRVAMATLTLLAMFAFVFLDTFQRGAGPQQAGADEVQAETNVGNLTRLDVRRLINQRQRANAFIRAAYLETHNPETNPLYKQFPQFVIQQLERELQNLTFRFGGSEEHDVVFGYLLRHEARRLGIVVDKSQIDAFIDQITSQKLSTSKFREITKDQGISPKDLYDILADEMQARLAINIEIPRNPQPPEQYWHYYQQLHTRQRLDLTAIPVSAFLDEVPTPSDKELTTFFEAHKTEYEQLDENDRWTPGFRQPRKVRLQYLTASYEAAELKVLKEQPVTDEDVTEYYEKNKETLYRERPIPQDDEAPLSPEMTPEKTTGDKPATEPPATDKPNPEKPADEKPADKKMPAEKTESKPAPAEKAADKDAPAKPTDKPATDKPAPKTDKPVEKPADKPDTGKKPVEKKTGKPAEKAPAKPVIEPAEAPVSSASKPADKPAEKPGEKPAEKPADKAEKTTDKPAEKTEAPKEQADQASRAVPSATVARILLDSRNGQPLALADEPADKAADKAPAKPEFVPVEAPVSSANKSAVKPTEAPAKSADKAEKPAEKSTTEKPADKPATEKPAEKTTDKPANKPAEKKMPAEKATDKPATEKPAPAKKAADKDAPAKPADKPAPKTDKPADKPAAEMPADKPAPAAGDKLAEPAPKYRPLDQDLRDQIREGLLKERTLKEMKRQAEQARAAFSDIRLKFSTQFDLTTGKGKQEGTLIEKSQSALQAAAKKLGMKYGETELVSQQELASVAGIGQAQEPTENQFSMNAVSVPEQAFFDEMLCTPTVAEDPVTSDTYLYWKVQDVDAHVPAFTDPGIREQVLTAWKTLKAQPLAEKRGEALAKLVRDSDKSMQEALGEQTVTGDKEAAQVTVRETPEFTWMREVAAPNPMSFGSRPVQISEPIEKPGREFMETVFEKLQPGDVGVAANGDQSVYYVVKVLDRKPALRDAFKETPLFGFNTPYEQLASAEQQQAFFRYREQLEKKYDLKLHDLKELDEEEPPVE